MKRVKCLLSVWMLMFLSQALAAELGATNYFGTNGIGYSVEYQFDDETFTLPLSYPLGEAHYPARITVRSDGDKIGSELPGTYVKHGCYEDVPQHWVELALADAAAKRLPPEHYGTFLEVSNGISKTVTKVDASKWATLATNYFYASLILTNWATNTFHFGHARRSGPYHIYGGGSEWMTISERVEDEGYSPTNTILTTRVEPSLTLSNDGWYRISFPNAKGN